MQISFDLKALTDQIQTFLNNFTEHLDINRLLGNIRATYDHLDEVMGCYDCLAAIQKPKFYDNVKKDRCKIQTSAPWI